MRKREDSYYKFKFLSPLFFLGMVTTFKRIIGRGWQSFCRDRGITAAAVFILVITIGLFTSLFLLKEVSQFLISYLEEKADLSVYFKEEVGEEDILKVKEQLSSLSQVKKIKYISKPEARENFIERHKHNPVLMESLKEVGQNPFLSSLNIKAFTASQYGAISDFFKKPGLENLIEKVDYHQRKPVIERIFSLTSILKLAGLSLAIVLAIISILVTFNTIRLTIYNWGEEIKIQRLVGASNWFIQGPFIIQGTIAGIFAALICLLTFGLICWALGPKMENFFFGLNLFQFFINHIWTIALIQFISGIMLGVISSTLAIRRYLRI